MVQPKSRHSSGGARVDEKPPKDVTVGYLPVHPADILGFDVNVVAKFPHGGSPSESSSSSQSNIGTTCCDILAPSSDESKQVTDRLLHFKEGDSDVDTKRTQSTLRTSIALGLLTLANTLNYMDRYTIAGVLPDIQKFYGDRSDAQMGLLQTAFIVFYMLCSPIFGYLGDRYNRTWLMSVGIMAWSLITLAGSFVPENMFWLFVFMRAMVGVGEASYSTIAPTIIADLFVADKRTNALSVFYFAIPVGSGLGYIIGAEVAHAMGGWQWALRVTPAFGFLCAMLILFVVKEPVRGQSEGAMHTVPEDHSWGSDLLSLAKNKSFVFSTFGFTAVAFVAGALSFWAPTFMDKALTLKNLGIQADKTSVSFKFGVITCVAGLLGVILGSQSARILRKKYPRADPLVCAFGLIMCAPFLLVSVIFAAQTPTLTWIFIFIGETFLCLNWAVVTDILLYVVPPNCRSTAEAAQILTGHLLGDAGSPYIVGVVSDWLSGRSTYLPTDYYGLQSSFYMMSFVAVLGGGCFLFTAIFLLEDKKKAQVASKALAANESRDNVLVTDNNDQISVARITHVNTTINA